VIYLDTSVALAQLLAEDRVPPAELWSADLVASRLLDYELWVRLHAAGLGRSHGDAARALLARLALLELSPLVLARALEPFPVPVRTLDALHLAAVEFLRGEGQEVALATYDARQREAARRLGIELVALDAR
jgi:predicted nucleic acid-binding protein